MTRIETTAVIGEDRTITVQLPGHVQPGEHSVVVLVDSGTPASTEEPASDSADHFRQEGNLRVLTVKLLDDPVNVVKQIYAEREHRFIFGPWE